MIVLDTSVWVALLNKSDFHHEKAKSLIAERHSQEIIIFDLIYAEILTVLRQKVGGDSCERFFSLLRALDAKILQTTVTSMTQASKYFIKYKKLSFFDSALLEYAFSNRTDLLTFDRELEKAWEEVQTN